MSFFYPDYSYSPRFSRNSLYNDYDTTPSESHYRRLAEEHERRALAALALAEEEERRSAERQRQAAVRRLQQSIPHHTYTSRPDDVYSYPPSYHHAAPLPPVSYEQQRRNQHERQIEEWLQRRRLREQEEEEYRRRQELEKRREEDVIRQLLRGFGMQPSDSAPATRSPRVAPRNEPEPEEEGPRVIHTFGHEHPNGRIATLQAPRREHSMARIARVPSPPAQPETSDLSSRLWAALSGGRSEEEKARILSDLGLNPPARPTSTSDTPVIPVIVGTIPTSTPSAPTPTPQPVRSAPKPTATSSIPKSPSIPAPATPAPTRLSPFAHIESIQVKLDASRSAFATNADATQYEIELNKLLAMLDQVESSGSESIRGARKALVRAVESELEELERRRQPAEPQMTTEGPAPVDESVSEETTDDVQDIPAAEDVTMASEDVASGPVETEQVAAPALGLEVASPAETAEEAPAAAAEGDTTAPVIVEPESPKTPAEEHEERGRSPTKAGSFGEVAATKPKRPSSVVIEEVPDEDDVISPRV